MMVRAFLKYIHQNKLIVEKDKVLLAVSGGIDSMVMADLFINAKIRFSMAHCNFGLRGNESDTDQQFVEEYSSEVNAELFTRHFDTQSYADKTHISVQMAARELRYRWFRELMHEKGFKKLAIAHHKEDQAETIIFNLIKGTGIAGLTGWKPLDDDIIRPLLFTDRRTIEAYARKNDLKWREDSSNVSTKYVRNKIRHEILPLFKEINPGFIASLGYTGIRLKEAEVCLRAGIEKLKKQAVTKSGNDLIISKDQVTGSLFPTLGLYEILQPFGFNYRQCVDLFGALDTSGKIIVSDRYVLNIDREHLILSPVEDHGDTYEYLPPVHIGYDTSSVTTKFGTLNFRISTEQIDKESIPADSAMAFLDFDRLAFPLTLRQWKPGDFFVPLGMSGKKKLSDFMIDEKIPVNLKRKVQVLLSGNDIVWITGMRIDDRFKIRPGTKKVLIVAYEKDQI